MSVSRRRFLTSVSMLAAGSMMPLPSWGFGLGQEKLKVALVGTGVRGISFWGRRLVEQYSDLLEFVGLSDTNEGRLRFASGYMNVACPTFLNFEEMVRQTKPDLVFVTTPDATHHEHIITGLELGCDVQQRVGKTTVSTREKRTQRRRLCSQMDRSIQ